MSLNHIGIVASDETKKKLSDMRKGEKHPLYGKTHSPESIQKMKETHSNRSEETLKKLSAAKSGENNPSYGKKWFHNPITLEQIRIHPNNPPSGFFPGRIPKINK
jgi:hypothetical protein